MNKNRRLQENMLRNISESLKSILNEASQKDKLQHATQFANRVKTIADRIERDCKDYDEKWALGYADQLRNAAEKMLKVLK